MILPSLSGQEMVEDGAGAVEVDLDACDDTCGSVDDDADLRRAPQTPLLILGSPKPFFR